MPKSIPMIITNNNILVKDCETDNFKELYIPTAYEQPNIPFYHQFAKDISKNQITFCNFIKSMYGKRVSKYIMAIIVPDDTSRLESIFINEFFLHSGVGKAVAQATMGQALSKDEQYISISKTTRNIVLQYIKNDEILAQKFYDVNDYDAEKIKSDAQRIHIDVEYKETKIYINNFTLDMDEFFDIGTVVSPQSVLEKISEITVEKI